MTKRSPMNTFKQPVEGARYLRTFLDVHMARLRTALGDKDRGASAVELAVITAVLVGLAVAILVIVVNFAIWFDARHAALAAAQQGDLVAREDASVNPGGWQGLAESAATSYYRGLNTSLISGVTAQAAPARNGMVSVTIRGKLTGIWP